MTLPVCLLGLLLLIPVAAVSQPADPAALWKEIQASEGRVAKVFAGWEELEAKKNG